MNFNKFINSDYLKENPICGIDTYKDELNLATGACTRQIKELVLTGNEEWTLWNGNYYSYVIDRKAAINTIVCSHFINSSTGGISYNRTSAAGLKIAAAVVPFISSVSELITWLATQYAAGTPVTVWYVLATPTTETITVPSGLSGTEEGFLNQSDTPTPTNPIYPTANTVQKWFDINHYIMGTSTDTITTPAVLYLNDTTATVGLKGNMEQSGAPTPTTPIQPQECGDLETTGEHTGQYKIPILSNSTTTPVYLGEVETTRRVKKLVLTGEESFILEGTDTHRTMYRMPLIDCKGNYGFCSHIDWKSSYTSSEYNRIVWQTGSGGTLYISLSNEYLESQTLAAFKAYLQQQYAAGTPVTVWYVLATPTTGIVNEPIRKIGDYADEVSGVSIPTTAGANTISVDTTLQPSEVSVNYKGWHPVSAVHERESGAWT